MLSSILEAYRARVGNVEGWIGEDMLGGLAKYLTKVPDAFIIGDPVIVVDALGEC